jgi:hypothetical protein
MTYKAMSLSGIEMQVSDDELAFCIICDQPWRHCTDGDDSKVIGPENARRIKEALAAEGFAIVRAQRKPEPR